MSSVVIKSVDEARVRKAMDDYAQRLLAARSEIEEIVVFGSFVRGDFAPGSDLDVFLLLTHSEKRVRDRVPDYLPRTFPVPLDLFPFTREDITALGPSPILDAVRDSKWRYVRGVRGTSLGPPPAS